MVRNATLDRAGRGRSGLSKIFCIRSGEGRGFRIRSGRAERCSLVLKLRMARNASITSSSNCSVRLSGWCRYTPHSSSPWLPTCHYSLLTPSWCSATMGLVYWPSTSLIDRLKVRLLTLDSRYYSPPHQSSGNPAHALDFPGASPYPSVKDQKAFEKGLWDKTAKQTTGTYGGDGNRRFAKFQQM
jgi:hypothetical protein